MCFRKIKAANESFLGKLQDLSGTNTREYGQAEDNTEDYFVLNDQYVEEEEVKELQGHTSGSIPPEAHTTVNNIKGMNIPWVNSCGGNIILTSYEFLFPSTILDLFYHHLRNLPSGYKHYLLKVLDLRYMYCKQKLSY